MAVDYAALAKQYGGTSSPPPSAPSSGGVDYAALAKQFGCAILLKGGHLQGDDAIDLLFHNDRLTEFSAPFVRDIATHGTGCTYSAAITGGLACGLSLEQAVERAKRFVTRSIARRFRWTSKSGDILDALRHWL